MSPVLEVAKFTSFLLFLLLGIRVARARGGHRRRAINVFLLYLLAINGLAGLTQIDNWPFTSYMLAAGRGNENNRARWIQFYGVDRNGREWRLDPLTWSPVFDSILQHWMSTRYPRLSAEDQREVQQFLLQKADSARAALAAAKRIGFERLIGPLASPYWWMLPRFDQAPAGPYVEMRVYSVWFVPREIEKDPGALQPELLTEWRK